MRSRLLVGSILSMLFLGAAGGAEDEALTGTRPLGVRGWRNDWTGRYPDATPVTAWDIEKGINVLWRVPTSRFGNAMPLVVGDRVYFTVDHGNLVCLEKMTGKVVWTSLGADPNVYAQLFAVNPQEKPWSKRNLNYGDNAGPTYGTPVTDGKRIWYRSSGMAFCHDLADGKRLWSTQLQQGGGHFANIGSLLLVGKVLVCEGGDSEYWRTNSKNQIPAGVLPKTPQTGRFHRWMVGVEADSGKILWDVGPLNGGGYSCGGTPVPVIVNDGKQQRVFVLTVEGHVIRPEDGKLVIPYVGIRSGIAAALGNRVLFNGALIEFSFRNPDELVAKKVWDVPTLGNLGGPAYSNGMVYSGYRMANSKVAVEAVGQAGAGSGGQRLYAVHEAATGRLVYQDVLGPGPLSPTPEWPSPAVAGKYLFFATLESVDVADISRGRPWPLAVNHNERMHNSPVFDGERMYLRTYDAITCIARKGEEGARYEREVNARTVIQVFPKAIGARSLVEVKPIADVTAWVGGPAFMYSPGQVPDKWLYAGPFPLTGDKDALDSLGGCAKAQPSAGKQVTFEGTTCTFAAVEARHIKPKGLDTDGPTKKDRKGQSFFFTWLVVGKAEYLTWNPHKPGVRLWVGGQEVLQNQTLKLDQGAYPVLMRIALPEDHPEGGDMVVDTAFAASEDPAETRKKDLAFVREGRDCLKLVIEALPGTAEARQAEALLKATE